MLYIHVYTYICMHYVFPQPICMGGPGWARAPSHSAAHTVNLGIYFALNTLIEQSSINVTIYGSIVCYIYTSALPLNISFSHSC